MHSLTADQLAMIEGEERSSRLPIADNDAVVSTSEFLMIG
jgi:hypothetical protein